MQHLDGLISMKMNYFLCYWLIKPICITIFNTWDLGCHLTRSGLEVNMIIVSLVQHTCGDVQYTFLIEDYEMDIHYQIGHHGQGGQNI